MVNVNYLKVKGMQSSTKKETKKGDLVYVLVYIHLNTVLSYVGKYHVQVHRIVPS